MLAILEKRYEECKREYDDLYNRENMGQFVPTYEWLDAREALVSAKNALGSYKVEMKDKNV